MMLKKKYESPTQLFLYSFLFFIHSIFILLNDAKLFSTLGLLFALSHAYNILSPVPVLKIFSWPILSSIQFLVQILPQRNLSWVSNKVQFSVISLHFLSLLLSLQQHYLTLYSLLIFNYVPYYCMRAPQEQELCFLTAKTLK